MLTECSFKAVYSSEEDNLLEDFYIPALKQSISYDRAVGFFSASMISFAAQGISQFVKNNGKMRLIVGGELASDDYQALAEGYRLKEIYGRLGDEIIATLFNVDDKLFQRRLEALSWLVACNRLEIKIALKIKGMYHEKIGIFSDGENKVVFQGSANETTYALLPDFNYESINVFPSWNPALADHFNPHIESFERLWDNKSRSKNTIVIPFPEVAQERLVQMGSTVKIPLSVEAERQLSAKQTDGSADIQISSPSIPEDIGGNKFDLRDHQLAALNNWKANDLNGVLKLATGAGKTITAIYGIVKIFDAAKRLFVVIAVPYQNLADQWVEVLKVFGILPIKCYVSSNSWEDKMKESIILFKSGALPFVCAVVVNRTLQSDLFQSCIAEISAGEFLWIGDECHHHESDGLFNALPLNTKLRLGLSATPNHGRDEYSETNLSKYYGPIVATYSLADALRDEVLTPYNYHIIQVELTVDESEEYLELSQKISSLWAITNGSKSANSSSDQQLNALLMKRARLLGNAENKLPALAKLLDGKRPERHTLFYCGDGSVEGESIDDSIRQIEKLSRLLHKHKWNTSRFTAQESRAKRESILNNFRLGLIDAMVAIRCLDEGIDVPACRTAYILASSKNPRQFIQRRGRILRKSPGKNVAEIFDFLVRIPNHISDDSEYDRRLIAGEIERVSEFASLALNKTKVVKGLMPLLEEYDLLHTLV